jgi:hypothetical protein
MSESFEVKVGLHQGSALSQLLFNIMFDVVTEGVRDNPPCCLLYADNIVLIAQSRIELERKLEKWRYALGSREMRISRSKTDYIKAKMNWIRVAGITGGRYQQYYVIKKYQWS